MLLGLLKKKSKDVELHHFWNSATKMLRIHEIIELNSCWQVDGYSFKAVNGGSEVDIATLGRFESKTVPIPSLVTLDSEVIFSFAENSIVRIKDGFFTYQQSDVTGAGETLSRKKTKRWQNVTGIIGGVVALGQTASYLTSDAVTGSNLDGSRRVEE